MKVLGITGGVGAGKSTVLAYLESAYGAEVILCDDTARRLQEPGGSCYEAMKTLLCAENGTGDDSIATEESLMTPEGYFDRAVLAKRLFADPELLKAVNGIVHPAVKEAVRSRIRDAREAGRPLVVVEAALLLEEHYDADICDEIWYIYADEETRIQRLLKQRGYTPEKSRQIMRSQQTEENFRRHCALTVDNSSANVQNTFDQIDKGLIEHGIMQHSQRKQR